MELCDIVTRKSTVVGESAGRKLILLDLESGNYFDAGTVGGFIWERLDADRDLQSIAEEVQQHFKVEAAVAEKDLLDFVGQLEAAKLVDCVSRRDG